VLIDSKESGKYLATRAQLMFRNTSAGEVVGPK
jgi:hypothetical protein